MLKPHRTISLKQLNQHKNLPANFTIHYLSQLLNCCHRVRDNRVSKVMSPLTDKVARSPTSLLPSSQRASGSTTQTTTSILVYSVIIAKETADSGVKTRQFYAPNIVHSPQIKAYTVASKYKREFSAYLKFIGIFLLRPISLMYISRTIIYKRF